MISCLEVTIFLILVTTESICSFDQAFANGCKVYPSEYAYNADSVTRTDGNCRSYLLHMPYIYCNGTRLRLIDRDLGSDEYSASEHYVWPAWSRNKQLLFIFSTRVSLATITMHYYSDSSRFRGLPSLTFSAVPDNFDIWDAPGANSYIEISALPPDGEPPEFRHISRMGNFSTRKVLLYKFESSFQFAVSEVEFFSCERTNATNINETLGSPTTTHIKFNVSITSAVLSTKVDRRSLITTVAERTSRVSDSNSITNITMTNFATKSQVSIVLLSPSTIAGVVLVILLLLLTTILVTVSVLFLYKRKYWRQKPNIDDGSYSTICRGNTQQLQPELLHTHLDLYNQIQLSPLTGQAELTPRIETENANCTSQQQYGNNLDVDINQPQDVDKSTGFEQPTFGVLNKKRKMGMESTHCGQTNDSEREREQNCNGTDQNSVEQRQPLEELYTAVKKTPKGSVGGNDEQVPPPPYTIEELYTAVQKKPKGNTVEDEAEAPPIPPHTIEELYTAVQKTKM